MTTFKPEQACIANDAQVDTLQSVASFHSAPILSGSAGLNTIAADVDYDILLVGLSGMIGLEPTLTALGRGKRVLTANKETFVTGGHLVQPYLNQIVPIDSEHCAIHQCLKQEQTSAVRRLLLTASGGPFRTLPKADFAHITPAQALKHPNWVMGRKITIDSATMMNKGLEVIEAHWLFGVSYEQIDVLIHPQSVVHSGVEFVDGATLFQLGTPDMRIPIQYALTYPERRMLADTVRPNGYLDWARLSELTFETPNIEKFPCLSLAYEAGRLGPAATIALNAADEVIVQAFLDEQIAFNQIPALLSRVIQTCDVSERLPTLAAVLELDNQARSKAKDFLSSATCSIHAQK
jgi:1-deoxy-D-xylulose-5-phosphate reductoisomerase